MKSSLIAAALLAASPILPTHAHQHLAAGFVDSNGNGSPDQGEPLRLVNAPDPAAVFHMTLRSGAQFGGYDGHLTLDRMARDVFPEDYFTFTALSDGQVEPADPRHAATGSYLWMEITSVAGPAGATFGFWDEGRSLSHSTPSIAFLANEPTGGFKFVISEPLTPDDPPEDPWGHVHDRGWSVSQPGDYYVTFTLHDLSTNGAGGGPIHSPSQGYTLHFVAVPEPGALALLGAGLLAAGLSFARRQTKYLSNPSGDS